MSSSFHVGNGEPEVDEVILRWRTKLSVGKLDFANENSETPSRVQRYVRLADVAKQLLVATEENPSDWTWESYPWAGLWVGRKEKDLKLIRVQKPFLTNYQFRARPEDDVVSNAIRTPHLVWVGWWNSGGHLSRTQLLCSGSSISGLESKVHPWPFGNVYDNSKICWGSVESWRHLKPENFGQMSDLFFGSPFNRDLWFVEDERLQEVLRGNVESDDDIDLSDHLSVPSSPEKLSNWLNRDLS
jgi:hypothetical protein